MKTTMDGGDGVSPIEAIKDRLVKRVPTRIDHIPLKSENKVRLTTAKAAEYLDLPTFEEERKFRLQWAQSLLDRFHAGVFLWENVAIWLADLGGTIYRVNGQHTCWMRLGIEDKDLVSEPTVTERVWSVKDLAQLKALYSADDQMPRSASHISRVNLHGSPAMRGVPTVLHPKLASR